MNIGVLKRKAAEQQRKASKGLAVEVNHVLLNELSFLCAVSWL